jgi:1,4-dihydroxy-2-naphthoyl-CoA hydrolase
MMAIWHFEPDLTAIQSMVEGAMAGHLEIEILEIGQDNLAGRMPVDEPTTQPLGMLHGGASVALAETLGSIGGNLCVNPHESICLGQSVKASHIRPVSGGHVFGRAERFHIGRRSQVWGIRIQNEGGELVTVARLTLAVIRLPKPGPDGT